VQKLKKLTKSTTKENYSLQQIKTLRTDNLYMQIKSRRVSDCPWVSKCPYINKITCAYRLSRKSLRVKCLD